MNNKVLVLIYTCLCLCIGSATHLKAQTFNYSQLQEHPRLLLKQGEEQRIHKSLSESVELQRVYNYMLDESDKLLTQPTLVYKKEGRRLLAVSREAPRRIFYLSFVYRMTNDEKYRLRAEQEMIAVCSFQDWNPSHFLDTGEMTLAVSLGYDWLYDKLQPETKKLIKESILNKGFAPSKDRQYNSFLRTENNWNQVCNAGMVYGALAIMEDHREEAIEIIERAMSTIGISVKGYAPDGNYPEGYNYWGYGTTFNVFLIAALELAITDQKNLLYLCISFFPVIADLPLTSAMHAKPSRLYRLPSGSPPARKILLCYGMRRYSYHVQILISQPKRPVFYLSYSFTVLLLI